MNNQHDIKIAEKVIRLRLGQMIINEKYKNREFKIPIHLAFGHEAIAIAISENMKDDDLLVLSHRNIHYNMARLDCLKPQLDEYFLKKEGMAAGCMGSMNLANRDKGLIYTSSILGNNFGVAAGVAMAEKVKGSTGLVTVITGDGAMEEGCFYESMVFLKSNSLCCMIIVENNEWSLATKIEQRRCSIDMGKFSSAFDVKYEKLRSNSVYDYIDKIGELREYALENNSPVCLEVHLSTLGDWYIKTPDNPQGKYANYHAGPAPEVELNAWPVLKTSNEDPVFALQEYFDQDRLKQAALDILSDLVKEIG